MEAGLPGLLDETAYSQTVRSPVKTSTAAKENIKWDENVFFKRQKIAQASESLFVPSAESPIAVSSEQVKAKKSLQAAPKLTLNDCSLRSDGTNSSLGILNVDNISDFSDNSFRSTEIPKKRKSKKKLQRNSRLPSEENDPSLKSEKIQDEFIDTTVKTKVTKDEEEIGSNSSSDIEYDGTNIPELNMDYNFLSHVSSNQAHSLHNVNSEEESGIEKSSTITKSESTESESSFSGSNSRGSWIPDNENQKFDSCNRESSVSMGQSIFENFETSFESLYDELLPLKKPSTGSKNEKPAKTIRVCPFLGMSSFEVEPILQKSFEITSSSDIENGRCSQNLSVDFRPEEISARSSSFTSSLKYDPSGSDNSNTFTKEDLNFHSVMKSPKDPFLEGDIEDEILNKFGSQVFSEKSGIPDKKDSSLAEVDSATFTANGLENISGISESPFHSSVLSKNFSGFDGENLCNNLGLSESDFFSSEAAKELLQKDKETFEKEQMFTSINSNKISDASNWSPPNQHNITAPSWFADINTDTKLGPDRHISIGTFISARSENIGTLSDDEKRERPYFGITVSTPPRPDSSLSEQTDSANSHPADGKFESLQDNNFKKPRFSALSDFLDDMSLTDPLEFASKILESCTSTVANKSEKQNSIHSKTTLNNESEHSSETLKVLHKKEPGYTNECNNTLIRSASLSSINKEMDIDVDVESKSTTDRSVNNSLNYSVGSSCETASVKTVENDKGSDAVWPSSKSSETQEFSRPASSCSSACTQSFPQGNAFSLHYGCMRYLNSAIEHNQNGITNLLQPGNSAFPCPHVCAQHTILPNFLCAASSNSVQPVIQNALSGQLIVSGSSVSFAGLQAPSELYFPVKIAVEDKQEMTLTIRNLSVIPCYYQVSCVSAYLNDSPLPFEMTGLSYNKTVPCNTENSTDIQLILAPKLEGKIEVNLQINAYSNSVGQTLNATPCATAKTKIQYEAVLPSVSILYKGKNNFNLGTVIAGSTFVEHVSVVNNCEVSVPLRINLSNESHDNQLYFGLKEISRQKHLANGTLRVLSPQVLVFRLPSSKNKEVPASLDIPVVFESVNGVLNSSITAVVDTYNFSQPLAFIKISATIGSAKLMLKDSSQNPIILRAARGATCSHSVTVINDGTLPVIYDIHIDSDVFSVSPNSLHLGPKQCATLSVNFIPQEYCTVKGKLLAAAEPHGQVFNIAEVIGYIKENYPIEPRNTFPQIRSSKPTRDSVISISKTSGLLHCDKKYLAWGGVDIGCKEHKNFILKNPKQEHVQVKLFIKEKSKGFMLLTENNQKTFVYELTLNAEEEKKMFVIFMPKNVACYSGKVWIKALTPDGNCFAVPLSGYGGTSSIKVLDLANDVGTGHCLNIDTPYEEDIVHTNIVLQNTGVRPAFVKLLLTYDGLVQNVISKPTTMNPSEFVLLENETKNVLVSVNCVNQNQISCNEIIYIYYGDEIMRQILRKKLKSGSSTYEFAYKINFNLPYDGEDKVPLDSSYMPSPKDEKLFEDNLKKIPIHIYLKSQNASFSRMSFGALSEVEETFSSLTLDSSQISLANTNLTSKFRRLTIEGHSPPVKDSAIRKDSRLSLQIPFDIDVNKKGNQDPSSLADELKNLKLNTWSVYPEELNVDNDNRDKRILLKNYSDLNLRFKVKWAIDVITVSPGSGILPANGEMGLRLNLITNNHSKLLEDYHENIKICCGGTEKVVAVKVFCDNKKTRSTSPRPTIFNDSIISGFLEDSDFLQSTLIESNPQSLNIGNIFSFPKEINLCTTETGFLSELNLIVSNPTIHTVTWDIRPSKMIFSEPDDSSESTKSPFEFPSTNGVLQSKATATIVIKFLPQRVARFQQFFELVLEYGNGLKQSCNIKVRGESVADFSVTNMYCDDERYTKKQNAHGKRRLISKIVTESDTYQLPATASGKSDKTYITIKNTTSQDLKIFATIKPKSPFILNHTTFIAKSRKSYKIPVFFQPLKPGNYESEIVFRADNGNELKVKLNGLCLT